MALIKVEVTVDGVVGIGKRALGEIGRLAIYKAGLYWWANYLPRHFSKAGSRRYNYKPRSGEPGSGRAFKGSYSWRKLKKYKNGDKVRAIGEVKPFVWSGRSRSLALGRPNITSVATNYRLYRVDVKLGHVRQINRVKGGYDELTRMTPDETKQLNRVFAEQFEKGLRRAGRTARYKPKLKG